MTLEDEDDLNTSINSRSNGHYGLDYVCSVMGILTSHTSQSKSKGKMVR